MFIPLSQTNRSIVRATLPTLRRHEAALIGEVYLRIRRNRHEAALFNEIHGGSATLKIREIVRKVLSSAASIAYAGLSLSQPAGISAEHYPYIAKALVSAIGKLLGQEATFDVMNAWDEILRVTACPYGSDGMPFSSYDHRK